MHIQYQPERQRWMIEENSQTIGEITYEIESAQCWRITHTIVNPQYRCQGIAGKLLDAMVAHAREQSIRLIPQCSYAKQAFSRKPEQYQDVFA